MESQALIRRTGGPEVIEWVEADPPPPGPGEVRMRNQVIGLNFIDTYHRDGTYPVDLPAPLGLEAAGVVEAVGAEVDGFVVGDRVATFGPARGAYATARNLPAAGLLPLPDDINAETAAALLLKGCTAEFLIERCGKVQSGWTVLVHAAAGGVGSILLPWLKAVGATVIGVVGDGEKAERARRSGADHVVLADEDVAGRCLELTDGRGVEVVFDGNGRATWESSLAACARRGLVISFGNASGPVVGVALGAFAPKSLFVTRPTLFQYYAEPAEARAGVMRLWEMVRAGVVRPQIGQRYPLRDVAHAHADLAARRTSGSTLLLP